MNIAITGADPAGIISARNTIKAGHSVVLFEKNTRIGGIWNPWSSGAYHNVCMQNPRYTFHYAGFPPGDIDEFSGVEQAFRYLSAVAGEDVLRESIRLNTEVVSLRKDAGHRVIRCASEGKNTGDTFDRVIIATGGLWQPRRLPLPGEENFSGTLITSRDYQEPGAFKGKNILIIGGGVSGANIASDLVPFARSISLSVKKMGLYLPRQFPTGPNDMMRSYLGRCLLSQMNYEDFIGYLDIMMPDYMQAYRTSSLLPDMANNNAVHVNERIIPNVVVSLIKIKPRARRFTGEGTIRFVDASQEKYDMIITCTGYEMPDYPFVRKRTI